MDAILNILERKAKEGVEVRLMYDDIGCAFLLPKYYDRVIEKRESSAWLSTGWCLLYRLC